MTGTLRPSTVKCNLLQRPMWILNRSIRLHSQAHLVPSWKGEEESIITHPMQVLVSHEDEVLKIFIPRRQQVVHGKLRREKKSMS